MSWVLEASVEVRSGSWGPGADARGREQYSSMKDTEKQQEAPWPATDLEPYKDNEGAEGGRAGFSGSGSQVF